MKIELINTGYFHADGGAMFGAIPKSAWIRKYPANTENTCILAMRCALISTVCGRIILIDNGVGNKHTDRLSYYQFFNPCDLTETLKEKNLTPANITDVVLTHLHFDHCGYTTVKDPVTGKIRPTFPNATCWVSESQFQNCLHPNPLEKDAYFSENILPVQNEGKLRLIYEDTALCAGIKLRLYNGHTAGQIVPYIETKTGTMVFAGDIIPLAASISPEWISAYDTFPITSFYEKIRMLEEAADKNQTFIYCHDAYTETSQVKKVANFFKATNLQSNKEELI